MASPVLQFKRGAFADLPALSAGEPGFTTDRYDLYIGTGAGTTASNIFVGSHRFWGIGSTDTGSSVKVVEGTDNGNHSISLKSPNALSASYTLTLPSDDGAADSVLTSDGSGNLSWVAGSNNSTFTGISKFTDTTDNTLGNADTGAVQIDGGLGVNKNVTIGAGLSVTGNSYFVGMVTFAGGTNGNISIGDSTADNIIVNGRIDSDLIPDDDGTYDLGSSSLEWQDIYAGGSLYGTESLVGTASSARVDYTVTVATKTADHRYFGSGSNSAYFIDGIESPFLTLLPGKTYRFDQSDNTNTNHPLKFYLESDKTTEYTSGITTNNPAGSAGAYTQIVVGDETPVVLHYQCASHAYMGNAVQTNSNVVNSNYAGTLRGGLNVSGAETILSSATVSDLTSGRVVLAGTSGSLEDSANLTFDGSLLTVNNTIDVTTVEVTNVKAKDGTSAITITDSSGDVSIASTLTVNGDLVVKGAQTIVNTETLKVEDSLIEVGLVNDGGDLVAPTSDSDIDVGLIFHYYSGSAKKAAVYWDDSVSRIVVASDVSESSSVLTATANTGYSDLEIKGLYINDCAGQSQVITCTGSERFLENITIDGGSFS